MTRTLLAAALLSTCSAVAVPVHAQSQQEQLDARYDRALAAGYKALFLCSAIANAEENGARRSADSVLRWELTGIDPRFAPHLDDIEHELIRRPDGSIAAAQAKFADDIAPRVAYHLPGEGCSLAPIGSDASSLAQEMRYDDAPPETPQAALADLGAMFTDPYPLENGEPLAGDLDFAFDNSTYGQGSRTTAVLVLADGKSRGERYAPDFSPQTPQRTWSVAKSIAATLIGRKALNNPDLIHRSARLGRDTTTDPRREITVDHLLRMASGRYSDTPGNKTDPLYWGGATVSETAQQWPLIHKPGTVFRYANNDTLSAIHAVGGLGGVSHPALNLFGPLGMHDTVAEDDWKWGVILSSQVWSTARDLAKLGQLYLDDGVLPSGERILPEGWVEYVSSPSGPQPEGRSWGYGAGFWLFNDHEGIPKDTFFAAGNRGQYVVIVPSRNIVIVRRGEDPTGTRFDIEGFTRDVLAALED